MPSCAISIAIASQCADRSGALASSMAMVQLRGVAIFGRPVAERLDDGIAGEILRNCTDGTHNACSKLYGAARRAARQWGTGRSIHIRCRRKAAPACARPGFTLDKTDAGGPAKNWHNREGRSVEAVGDDLVGGKWRWVG